MKKSAITLGLLLGGLTASAAWATDIESDPTPLISGHKPEINVPGVVESKVDYDYSSGIEINLTSSANASDEDQQTDFENVTYWLELEGDTSKKYGETTVPYSDVNTGNVHFEFAHSAELENLKNHKVNFAWTVNTAKGWPAETKVSDVQRTTSPFDVSGQTTLSLSITGGDYVNGTLVITANDGSVLTLNPEKITLTVVEPAASDGSLYDEADANIALQDALTALGSTPKTEISIPLPKEVQGYKIKATMEKDPITRSTLR